MPLAAAPHILGASSCHSSDAPCSLAAPSPAQANHYIESHPQSHFRKNLIVARQTPTGRVTILNDELR